MDELKWGETKRAPEFLYIAVEMGKVDKTATYLKKPRKYYLCSDDLMDMRYFVRHLYLPVENGKTIEDFVIMKVKIEKGSLVQLKEAKTFEICPADKPLRLCSDITYELIDVFRAK